MSFEGSQRPDEAWSYWIGPTHWHTEIVGIKTWWQLLSCVWIESSHIPPDCRGINTQQLLWIVILMLGLSCCVHFALTHRVPFLGYNPSLRLCKTTWNSWSESTVQILRPDMLKWRRYSWRTLWTPSPSGEHLRRCHKGDSGSQLTDDRMIQPTCSPSYIQKGRSGLDEKPNQQSKREETIASLECTRNHCMDRRMGSSTCGRRVQWSKDVQSRWP